MPPGVIKLCRLVYILRNRPSVSTHYSRKCVLLSNLILRSTRPRTRIGLPQTKITLTIIRTQKCSLTKTWEKIIAMLALSLFGIP